jgi:hypothetical protein
MSSKKALSLNAAAEVTDHKRTLINDRNRECAYGVHAHNDHYENNTFFVATLLSADNSNYPQTIKFLKKTI